MTRSTRTAACSCGQLRIDIAGEPRGVGLCHCFACQRRTGSVFATPAAFAEPFVVHGTATEYVRTGDAGAQFRFRFCPTCGTNLFHTEEGRSDGVSVAVGCFADPGFPSPTISIHESRRHPWVQLPPDITRFDRDPDGRTGVDASNRALSSAHDGPARTAMNPIRRERLSAQVDGDFAVFLIGMRINRPWRIDRWWPVAKAMPRMLAELERRPELGLLHHEQWVGRTFLVLQYWRSIDQLLDYATNRQAAHLPAWRAFNQAIGTDGTVGIWHETYSVSAGRYESVYVNMPAFGLGGAGSLQSSTGGRQSASGRLGRIATDDAATHLLSDTTPLP